MEKLCCIISAGDVNVPLLKENKEEYSFFIAADLGYQKAKEAGIIPSLLVGDFDSLGQPSLVANSSTAVSSKTQIKQFPVSKDYSDTQLAIEEGIKLGYSHFHVYGALGGDRFSHSLANIQTLCAMKSKNVSVTLMGEKESVFILKNETFSFSCQLGTTFSVFSLSDKTTNITITGAKYPLENHTLTNAFPIGLSNQSTHNTVTITCGEGLLLVVLEFYY